MILDKLFGREGVVDILVKSLKAKTKGESLDFMKEEIKRFSEEERIEMAYCVGVVHGVDEGIYNREKSAEFLKNLNILIKLSELKDTLNKKSKTYGG